MVRNFAASIYCLNDLHCMKRNIYTLYIYQFTIIYFDIVFLVLYSMYYLDHIWLYFMFVFGQRLYMSIANKSVKLLY